MTPNVYCQATLLLAVALLRGGRCGLRLLAGCPGSSHHQGRVANAGLKGEARTSVGLRVDISFNIYFNILFFKVNCLLITVVGSQMLINLRLTSTI